MTKFHLTIENCSHYPDPMFYKKLKALDKSNGLFVLSEGDSPTALVLKSNGSPMFITQERVCRPCYFKESDDILEVIAGKIWVTEELRGSKPNPVKQPFVKEMAAEERAFLKGLNPIEKLIYKQQYKPSNFQ